MGDKRFDTRPSEKTQVREHERRTKTGTTRVRKHFRSKRKGEKFTTEESKDIQKWLNAEEFSDEEFHAGMNEELEHWDITQGDPFETGAIVIAHLREDPNYYKKLDIAMTEPGVPLDPEVLSAVMELCDDRSEDYDDD
jgi:hypothetical protein